MLSFWCLLPFLMFFAAARLVTAAENANAEKGRKFRFNKTDCRLQSSDIVLLLDSSGSIKTKNFNLAKEFLTELTKQMQIDDTDRSMQIAMMTFSDSHEKIFGFRDYQTKEDIELAIEKAKYIDSGTQIGKAMFEAVRQNFDSDSSGDRPDAPNLMLIVTDGMDQSDFGVAAPRLYAEANNVIIWAIGIGDGVDEEYLLEITGDPDRVTHVDTFRDLSGVFGQVCASIASGTVQERPFPFLFLLLLLGLALMSLVCISLVTAYIIRRQPPIKPVVSPPIVYSLPQADELYTIEPTAAVGGGGLNIYEAVDAELLAFPAGRSSISTEALIYGSPEPKPTPPPRLMMPGSGYDSVDAANRMSTSLAAGAMQQAQAPVAADDMLADATNRQSLSSEAVIAGTSTTAFKSGENRQSLSSEAVIQQAAASAGGDSIMDGINRQSMSSEAVIQQAAVSAGGDSIMDGLNRQSLSSEAMIQQAAASAGGDSFMDGLNRQSLSSEAMIQQAAASTGGDSFMDGLRRQSLSSEAQLQKQVSGIMPPSATEAYHTSNNRQSMSSEAFVRAAPPPVALLPPSKPSKATATGSADDSVEAVALNRQSMSNEAVITQSVPKTALMPPVLPPKPGLATDEPTGVGKEQPSGPFKPYKASPMSTGFKPATHSTAQNLVSK